MQLVITHDEFRKYFNSCKLSKLTRVKFRCFHEFRFCVFQDFFFTWRWVFCNRNFLFCSNFVVFAWTEFDLQTNASTTVESRRTTENWKTIENRKTFANRSIVANRRIAAKNYSNCSTNRLNVIENRITFSK